MPVWFFSSDSDDLAEVGAVGAHLGLRRRCRYAGCVGIRTDARSCEASLSRRRSKPVAGGIGRGSRPVVGDTASRVFRPSPVFRTTVVGDRVQLRRPRSASSATPTVTPPRRLGEDALRAGEQLDGVDDLLVVDVLDGTAGAPAMSSTYGPSAGLPMASDLAMVSGLHRADHVVPGLVRRGDRRAALGLARRTSCRACPRPGPSLISSWSPLSILVSCEPEAIGMTTLVGQAPAELLGDLVGQRLASPRRSTAAG